MEDYAGNIKKVSDNISYDNVSAELTSVTSSNPDIRVGSYPYYGIGTPVTLNVLFSEPLEKIGNDSAPEIYLDTGFSSSRTAGYVSGTGTDNHSYSYTVTEGDNTTDLSLDNQTLGKQASYFEMSGCPVNLLTLPERIPIILFQLKKNWFWMEYVLRLKALLAQSRRQAILVPGLVPINSGIILVL